MMLTRTVPVPDPVSGGKQLPQSGAPPHQPRLHRAQVDAEHVGNLFIGEAFDLAQHHYAAERRRHLAKRAFHVLAEFILGSLLKRRAAAIGQRVAQ